MTTEPATDAVRRALRDVTADLVPAPDVLSRARRGGRRRQLRRRAVLAGVLVLAVAATGGLLAQRPHRPPVPIPPGTLGARLLTAATGGDLAGDRAYLASVVDAFDSGHDAADPGGEAIPPLAFDSLVGSPHVAWAGTTAAGRAAIVAQATDITDRSQLGNEDTALYGVHVVLGFVGPGRDGDPTVLANEILLTPSNDTWPNTYALRLGTHRDTLLVADAGQPAWYSTRRTYDATGVHRDWRAVPFAGNAAVLTVPLDPAFQLATATTLPAGDTTDLLLVAGTPQPGTQPDHTLRWGAPPSYTSTGGSGTSARFPLTAGTATTHNWGGTAGPDDFFFRALRASPFYDSAGFPATGALPWLAYAATPDGTRVVVSELQYGTDPSQIYAAVLAGGKTQVGYGGPADRTATLPVHVRLPDNLGWVVAARGAILSYRTATGTWRPAGNDAALLPADAAAVQVNGVEVAL